MRAALLAICIALPVQAQDFFTLKGHGGPIMDIAVAPSGQIASASFDNSVGLWAATIAHWFEGHRAAVNTVIFADDTVAYSAGDDYTIWRWNLDARTGAQIGQHDRKVMALALSPDGQTLASASWDGTIGLWPLPAGAPTFLRGHTQGVNDIAFTPDSAQLYSASTDGTIRIWDVAGKTLKQRLLSHGFGINTLILNTNDGWLAYGAIDGATRFVDPVTADPLGDLTLDRRPILAMAYSPAQHQLAVGDGEGFIMVINTTDFSITRDFRATQRGPIWALEFSANGQNLHAGGLDDVIYSWPVDTMDAYGQMTTGTRSFLADPKTLPNGERQFKRKCSICHTLTPSSARRAGPTLHNLFGRPAGIVADYTYSPILTGSDIIWDDTTIDALFDLGPDHYIPGTKMPMQRIAKPSDRADLIAYLRTATKDE